MLIVSKKSSICRYNTCYCTYINKIRYSDQNKCFNLTVYIPDIVCIDEWNQLVVTNQLIFRDIRRGYFDFSLILSNSIRKFYGNFVIDDSMALVISSVRIFAPMVDILKTFMYSPSQGRVSELSDKNCIFRTYCLDQYNNHIIIKTNNTDIRRLTKPHSYLNLLRFGSCTVLAV